MCSLAAPRLLGARLLSAADSAGRCNTLAALAAAGVLLMTRSPALLLG
jgi:hypothetical protein